MTWQRNPSVSVPTPNLDRVLPVERAPTCQTRCGRMIRLLPMIVVDMRDLATSYKGSSLLRPRVDSYHPCASNNCGRASHLYRAVARLAEILPWQSTVEVRANETMEEQICRRVFACSTYRDAVVFTFLTSHSYNSTNSLLPGPLQVNNPSEKGLERLEINEGSMAFANENNKEISGRRNVLWVELQGWISAIKNSVLG